MTTLREAAKQALEAIEHAAAFSSVERVRVFKEAAEALRAALAEPVQELQRKPLTEEEIEQEYKKGYADGYAAGYDNGDSEGFTRGTDSMVPASLAAWRAETKPLTEAQIYAAIKGIDSLKAVEVARAIERAHGIGGNDE